MADTTLSKEAEQVMELVSKMSVLELSQLVKAMEEKFGVKAQAAVAVAAAAAPTAAVEEKDSFDVVLTDAGSTKINVIKAVKNITGLGLAEAKALVDGAPKTVKEGAKKDEAAKMKKEIEEAGGKVELK